MLSLAKARQSWILERPRVFLFVILRGEPLLAEYLFAAIGLRKENQDQYVHLVTNGYLLNAECALRLMRRYQEYLSARRPARFPQ